MLVGESLYHVWFSTKRRKEALDGDIGDEVRRLLIETAQRAQIRLLEVEAVADHVHLLVGAAGARMLPSILKQLKGATAREVFLRYPELKLDMGSNFFWQRGHGWREIGPDEEAAVPYIRTQRTRPLRHER